jgi:hypothetical protein
MNKQFFDIPLQTFSEFVMTEVFEPKLTPFGTNYPTFNDKKIKETTFNSGKLSYWFHQK